MDRPAPKAEDRKAAPMSWFWIIGIVANVSLTVLAIVWVIRQGKTKRDAAKNDEDSSV